MTSLWRSWNVPGSSIGRLCLVLAPFSHGPLLTSQSLKVRVFLGLFLFWRWPWFCFCCSRGWLMGWANLEYSSEWVSEWVPRDQGGGGGCACAQRVCVFAGKELINLVAIWKVCVCVFFGKELFLVVGFFYKYDFGLLSSFVFGL